MLLLQPKNEIQTQTNKIIYFKLLFYNSDYADSNYSKRCLPQDNQKSITLHLGRNNFIKLSRQNRGFQTSRERLQFSRLDFSFRDQTSVFEIRLQFRDQTSVSRLDFRQGKLIQRQLRFVCLLRTRRPDQQKETIIVTFRVNKVSI